MKEGAVNITLDKERSLYFDINVISDVDDQLRSGVIGLVHSNDWRVSDVRTVLWGGLKSEDPALTKEQVGRLMQDYVAAGGVLNDLTQKIYDAFFAAGFLRQEKKTEVTESPSPASANGSGTPSETPTDR